MNDLSPVEIKAIEAKITLMESVTALVRLAIFAGFFTGLLLLIQDISS